MTNGGQEDFRCQTKGGISAVEGELGRVETPDNPKLYGDLQSPVMDDWK